MHTEINEQLEERFDRVRAHTPEPINRRIDRTTEGTVASVTRQGRDAVVRRLTELDREWDVDRALMANFAIVGGAAYVAGLKRYSQPSFGPRRKGLLYFVGVQMAFMMVHAVAGWCPPVSVFRRLGFRTRTEIETERAALLEGLASNGHAA
jgi:hypothetical protein